MAVDIGVDRWKFLLEKNEIYAPPSILKRGEEANVSEGLNV